MQEDVDVPPVRGRRLTKWSFEEYEDAEYNVTGSRRDLKAQHVQRSITGRGQFGAHLKS